MGASITHNVIPAKAGIQCEALSVRKRGVSITGFPPARE
jgi:hypothetical protein